MQKTFLVFFCCYILIFSIAANTQLLDWKRSLTGLDDVVPRNWLSLNWTGDWRYKILPQDEPPDDIIVITVDPSQGRDNKQGRYEIAQIIQAAVDNGARGIAFDYFLPEESELDSLLCYTVKEAKIPVFIGYTFQRLNGDLIRMPTAASLESCLPMDSSQGHLTGYLNSDNQVRAVPAYFKGQHDRPAFSVQIAHSLSPKSEKEMAIPELVYFSSFGDAFPQNITYEKLTDSGEAGRLRDRFIIVGERSERDSWETPFGKLPGVFIHAYAVQSIRSGLFIVHQSSWSSFLLVFGLCFLLSVLVAENISTRKLIIFAVVASVAVIAGSAAAIYFWRIWLAVIYPLTALWLLFGMLLAFRHYSHRS